MLGFPYIFLSFCMDIKLYKKLKTETKTIVYRCMIEGYSTETSKANNEEKHVFIISCVTHIMEFHHINQ